MRNLSILTFSARTFCGNCYSIAKFIAAHNQGECRCIDYKLLGFGACSFCDCACISKDKCVKDDGFHSFVKDLSLNRICLIIPVYCGSFSSIWQSFNERLQGYFCSDESDIFDEAVIICVSNLPSSFVREAFLHQISIKPNNIFIASTNQFGQKGIAGSLIENKQFQSELLYFLKSKQIVL